MKIHDPSCFYAVVQCPKAVFNNGCCAWTGPLSRLHSHIVDSRCAAYSFGRRQRDNTIYTRPLEPGEIAEVSYISVLLSDAQLLPPMTGMMFSQNVNFRVCVMLVDAASYKMIPFLYLRRGVNRMWTLSVHSFFNEEIRRHFRVSVYVTKASKAISMDVSPFDHEGWGYKGEILANNAPEAEIRASGSYLDLPDARIKKLIDENGKDLFRAWVRIMRC